MSSRALKTNRILYPQGIRQSAKEFARYIDVSDTHLVTVGGETNRVYRYEGALNDIPNAVVLFCWKTDQPMTSEHLRCFLSTDTELSDQAILEYYAKRWSIESYFRQTKETLGFDRYRIRHERA
ncbi:IS701 family transposase, partial [Aeribacillus pallidus]|uniref:transposase n=1 Tax=Aeribacillus pallidus TaxID=33936 RepID=UPI0010EC5923